MAPRLLAVALLPTAVVDQNINSPTKEVGSLLDLVTNVGSVS